MSVSYGQKVIKSTAGQSRIRIVTLSGCVSRIQLQGFNLSSKFGVPTNYIRESFYVLVLCCVINLCCFFLSEYLMKDS